MIREATGCQFIYLRCIAAYHRLVRKSFSDVRSRHSGSNADQADPRRWVRQPVAIPLAQRSSFESRMLGIVFDLMRNCALLKRHIAAGKVAFGINEEIRDFQHDRKKKLDLVLCTPASGRPAKRELTLSKMADHYEIELTASERAALAELPLLRRAPVGSVLMALEAKACMTAH